MEKVDKTKVKLKAKLNSQLKRSKTRRKRRTKTKLNKLFVSIEVGLVPAFFFLYLLVDAARLSCFGFTLIKMGYEEFGAIMFVVMLDRIIILVAAGYIQLLILSILPN